jgi:hypothetical protein
MGRFSHRSISSLPIPLSANVDCVVKDHWPSSTLPSLRFAMFALLCFAKLSDQSTRLSIDTKTTVFRCFIFRFNTVHLFLFERELSFSKAISN